MSKGLKITLFIFLGIFGMCIVTGLLLPTSWEAESSVTIAAPPERIHPLVNDFHNWRKWSKPSTPDPSVKYTYAGPEQGVGAEQSWIGERSRGLMRITESDPDKGVQFETAMLSAEINGDASIVYEPTEGGTRVTWKGRGDVMPVVGGLIARRIGEGVTDFYANSLGELKTLVEAGDATPEAEAAPLQEADGGAEPLEAPDAGAAAAE